MGKNNPGRFRKEGRQEFEPCCLNKEEYCPYPVDSFKRKYWLEGWHEEEKEYNKEKERLKRCPYQALRNKIYQLKTDPEIIDILEDILMLIEKR